MRSSILALALLGVATAAAAKDAYIDTSDEALRTAEGLYPVQNSKMEAAFAKPGVDLTGYDQFMLDTVDIAYREERRTRRQPGSSRPMRSQLNDTETTNMQEIFNEIFVDELTKDDAFTIVDEPGTGVLRVTPHILDLVINVPLDPTPSRSRTYVDSVADMTLMLEFRDSVTGELLVQAADRREASTISRMELSTPVNNRRQVERVLRYWANLMRKRMELATSMSVETR